MLPCLISVIFFLECFLYKYSAFSSKIWQRNVQCINYICLLNTFVQWDKWQNPMCKFNFYPEVFPSTLTFHTSGIQSVHTPCQGGRVAGITSTTTTTSISSQLSHTSDLKTGISGIIGSPHGLAVPACCLTQWNHKWSATSVSVWQHVQLSELIHP